MFNGYDTIYALGLAISSPVWLLRGKLREKVFSAFRQRMGAVSPRHGGEKAVWIHAVSVGEMNATRALIVELRRLSPGLVYVVSTTTRTGYERGMQLYDGQPDVKLIRYPLDFTAAIRRALDATRPSAVVLMELEIWPNFVRECTAQRIPVMIANGRITEPSYRKYLRIKPITRLMMRRLSSVCVQDQTYADRFLAMGARAEVVRVLGTMKFDTAAIAGHVDGDVALAAATGLSASDVPVWVCGSTGPGEEEAILLIYRNLLTDHPTLRLAIIPRHPERFNAVADLIKAHSFGLVRRSQLSASASYEAGSPAVVLGDTMGELRKFYSLASIVFVGRSLVDLGARQHGSDMIEPAALGKPVIVGPYTANFADAMLKFRAAAAILEVSDAVALHAAVARLLADVTAANMLGQAAQNVVQREKGATLRHTTELLALLKQANGPATAST